jgi:hypothetical protein
MSELVKRLFHICLLTRGPQDLPYSVLLMRLLLLVYFATGMLSLLTYVSAGIAIAVMLVDLAIMLGFSWLCLQAFKLQPRFVQMITALAGVGSLFSLLSVPLLAQIQLARETGQMAGELSFLLLFLISWNLAVIAHVFREAFNVRLLAAFLLTLAYKMIEFSISQLLFPELGA